MSEVLNLKGGTIYKEGNKWIWKSPYYEENGKKKRIRKSFDTEEQAIARRELYFSYLKGGEVNNFIEQLTVRQAYEKWIAIEWNNEEHITFNTQRGYVNVYETHILPYLGNLPIDNLNVKPFNLHLQELAKKGRSQKTLLNIKQALVKLLKYCKKRGWIDVNNEDGIKIPDTLKSNRARVVNIISQSEYELVYNHMAWQCSQYAPFINFLRHTGIRVEELSIKLSDINGNHLKIRRAIKRRGKEDNIRKTYRTVSDYLKTDASYRTVPLSKEGKQAIIDVLEWKEENGIKSDYIFCTRTGALIEERNILRAFHSACDAVGIERRGLHSLRKLFCKTLKDLPLDWEQVRIIMGHESIKVTQDYYYSMDTDEMDAIAERLSKIT